MFYGKKTILNSRYILHVVIALSQLLMEESGLAEYVSYSPLLCCWFTEKTKIL